MPTYHRAQICHLCRSKSSLFIVALLAHLKARLPVLPAPRLSFDIILLTYLSFSRVTCPGKLLAATIKASAVIYAMQSLSFMLSTLSDIHLLVGNQRQAAPSKIYQCQITLIVNFKSLSHLGNEL